MADDLQLESALAQLLTNAANAMHEAVIDGPAVRANDLTPKDTTTLADSEQVSEPIIEGNIATVTLSFGRQDDRNPKTGQPSAAYAAQVHERLDVPHATGEAKFLEKAVLEAAPEFSGRIAAKMR